MNSAFKCRGSASREILYDEQKHSNHIGMNCAVWIMSSRAPAQVTSSERILQRQAYGASRAGFYAAAKIRADEIGYWRSEVHPVGGVEHVSSNFDAMGFGERELFLN